VQDETHWGSGGDTEIGPRPHARGRLRVSAEPGVLRRPSAHVVIRPTTGPIPPRLNELWAYRELFLILVWRDVKVRYAQTKLGFAWMLFQPLAMLLVYTYAFSHLARVSIPGGVPYPVFALAGLTLWIFVSRAVLTGAESIVQGISLVKKTPAPRIILPLAANASVLVDFLVSLVLFLVISAAYGRHPGWQFVVAVPLLLASFLLVIGLSLFLSATNVRYRDVGQALPFLVTLWFFLSPVAYQLQTPGLSWQTIVQAANPMVGLILAFRWALVGTPLPHGLLAVSLAETAAVFALGVVRFAHAERTLADDV
jgi:homopolymeric O-antigen transport system permease protein